MGCNKCARCCEYFTFEISGDNKQWISELKKFFEFTRPELASIIEEPNLFALQFKTPCKFLKDKRCSIYEKRPEICRNFLCRKAKK